MKQILLLFFLSALLFPEHPEHPEHPTTKKEPQLTVETLAISIENYIQNDMNLKGGFFVYDKNEPPIEVFQAVCFREYRFEMSGLRKRHQHH